MTNLPTPYFHGGYPSLCVGDLIEPPDVTGTTHVLSRYTPPDAPHGRRRDVVYLARVQDHARAYAALYPDGALYRAEPDGPTEPDPDAPDLAVTCRRARVVEVIRPRIVFAHRRPEDWLRMLMKDVIV